MPDDAALGLRGILYAGVSARNRRVVERLERHFYRARRILVPNFTDWAQTGKVLALLAAKYDHEEIGKGRLTNDALIAMSAGRLGITLITVNARDFEKLAEFRHFQWRVEKPKQRLRFLYRRGNRINGMTLPCAVSWQ